MTQNDDRHSYPNYTLTTSLYFSELVYRLVCWGEQVYRTVSARLDADNR